MDDFGAPIGDFAPGDYPLPLGPTQASHSTYCPDYAPGDFAAGDYPAGDYPLLVRIRPAVDPTRSRGHQLGVAAARGIAGRSAPVFT